MAEYKSQYKELGFYVDGEFKRFSGGRFATEDEATIEVLSNIADAQRVDESKAEETPKPTKVAKPKAPAKKTSEK